MPSLSTADIGAPGREGPGPDREVSGARRAEAPVWILTQTLTFSNTSSFWETGNHNFFPTIPDLTAVSFKAVGYIKFLSKYKALHKHETVFLREAGMHSTSRFQGL